GTLIKAGPGTMNVNGAQSHSPGAILNATGGTTNLNTDAGAGGVNLTLKATTATALVNMNVTTHLAGLQASGGGTVALAAVPPGSPPPYVPGNKYVQTASNGGSTLSIDAISRVDLGNGSMIVDYTGGPSALASVTAMIAQGFDGGLWDLPGLTSSVAQNDATFLTALGVLDNDQGGAIYDGITGAQFNFDGGGDAVPLSSILVKYTYYGDTDLNGQVTGDDFTNFLAGFNGQAPATWLYGDFDY